MEYCIHISLHLCEWDTVNMAKAIQTLVSKYQSTMCNNQEDENTSNTTEEAWNYSQLKLSIVVFKFGGTPFESWAERRKFLLRLNVGLLSTS